MLWEQVEKVVKSIMKYNFYILILLLMILLSSLIFPTSTKLAFENLFQILPNFLSNYLKNLSLTNEQIFSIFQLLSILHILSLCIFLLSAWKMNYYKEAHSIFGFFLTLNTYFILFFSILYRLDLTTFSFIIRLGILKYGVEFKSLFPIMSFSISCFFIIIVLSGFIRN